MEMTQKNFEKLLKFGQEGEHEVAKYLIEKGVSVLPLYQFNAEEAPYIVNMNNKLISPDLICFNKVSFFVEVKTKNQWVEFKGSLETGLDKRHYLHYLEISKTTNLQVYLFFNHKQKEPLGIYCCKLEDFTREWDGMYNNVRKSPSMVFYDYSVLTKII